MLLGISMTLRDYLRSAISDTSVEIGMFGASNAPPMAETVLVFLYAVEELYELRTPAPRAGRRLRPL